MGKVRLKGQDRDFADVRAKNEEQVTEVEGRERDLLYDVLDRVVFHFALKFLESKIGLEGLEQRPFRFLP